MSNTPQATVPPKEEPVKAKIAKRIRKARKNRGMSKAELSRRTGAANATITRWEEETNLPPLHQIMKVGEALDYSLAYFLQDLDEKIEVGQDAPTVCPVAENGDRAEMAVRLKDLVQAAPSVQILVSVADEPQRRQADLQFGASENVA